MSGMCNKLQENRFSYRVLGQQLKLVATNVTVVVLKDTGHWVSEERPKETTDALVNFL